MADLRQRSLVPALLFTGWTTAIMSSLGAPLIPRLAKELHTSISDAQWTLTAALVVAAVLSPIFGQLGDGRQRTRVLRGGLVVVAAGCVLAALARSLGLLIVGRALQGVGFGFMPLTIATARDLIETPRSTRVIAAISVIGAAGIGLGYPLTGFVADLGGVWTTFWFGLGVSLLALALVVWAVPPPRNPRPENPPDLVGAALVGTGLVGLLIGLDRGPEWGWGASRTLELLAAGVVLLAVWSWHELRARNPLVDLRLLRHPAVLTAIVAGVLLGLTFYLTLVVVVQLAQQPFGFGQSLVVTGLTLLPLSVLSTSASRSLPWLEARIGIRPIVPAGAGLAVAASVFFGLTADQLWQAFVTMGILGLAFGYTFAAIPGLIVASVPHHHTSSAMGLYQVSRFVGFATGSGIAITLIRVFGDHGAPSADGYRAASLCAGGFALAAAVAAWLLPGRAIAPDLSAEALALEVREGMLAAAGLEDAT